MGSNRVIGHLEGSRLIRVAALSAIVLARGLAAASCGGDDGGGDSGGADGGAPAANGGGEERASGETDPCSLLTTAEVEAAGVKSSDPKPVESQTGGQACNYGDDPLKGVQVIVQPGGGQAYFDQSKALLPAAKPISGLGDKAVLDDSNPQQVSALVLEGDTVLSLGGSISAADAQSLAEKALGRLGG